MQRLPEVRRFLWDDTIISQETVNEIIHKNASMLRDEGCGLYMAYLHDGTLVGYCGFWDFFEPPRRQIIFALMPDHTDRGYATEMVRALLAFGSNALQLKSIEGATDAENFASQAVMLRAGMRESERNSIDGKPTIFYVYP